MWPFFLALFSFLSRNPQQIIQNPIIMIWSIHDFSHLFNFPRPVASSHREQCCSVCTEAHPEPPLGVEVYPMNLVV